jgi:hypothetical protein
MSSKEKVLAIRPEVYEYVTTTAWTDWIQVISQGVCIGCGSNEFVAWAAAYKYLTNEGKNN